MTKNKEVVELLRKFAKYYDIANDNYRSMAYRNAAMTIENLDDDILIYQDKLTTLPRIGTSIAEKIKEYLTTGRSDSLEELKHSVVRDSFKAELYEIEGFGKQTIEELFKHYTIRNMEDLENVLRSKTTAKLPGFGEKKLKKLLESLEEHKSGGIRRGIPLFEALISANSLLEELKDDPDIEKISIAGSLRRMKPIVNDIDIVASVRVNRSTEVDNKSSGINKRENKSHEVLLKFSKLKDVKRVISVGEKKATVVLNTGIQADMRAVQPEEYFTALQYFTGSKEHNIQIRAIAKDKGYLLSEYGLFDRRTEERIIINSEEEIYEKLGLEYPEPTKR